MFYTYLSVHRGVPLILWSMVLYGEVPRPLDPGPFWGEGTPMRSVGEGVPSQACSGGHTPVRPVAEGEGTLDRTCPPPPTRTGHTSAFRLLRSRRKTVFLQFLFLNRRILVWNRDRKRLWFFVVVFLTVLDPFYFCEDDAGVVCSLYVIRHELVQVARVTNRVLTEFHATPHPKYWGLLTLIEYEREHSHILVSMFYYYKCKAWPLAQGKTRIANLGEEVSTEQ